MLFPFQNEGVMFLAQRKSALLADDMGIGKTIQAIVAAKLLFFLKIIVICPAITVSNWKFEFLKWNSDFSEEDIFIIQNGKARLPENRKVVITSYDLLNNGDILYQIKARRWELCICDEAHYLKSIESKRSHNVLGSAGIVHLAKYNWMLTGTPILNRPVELFPMLKVFADQLIKPYNTYLTFGKHFCAGFDNGYEWDFSGASNLEELSERIKPFYLRRTKQEVLQDFPEKFVHLNLFPVDSDINPVLDYEEETQAAEKETSFSTLRRLTGVCKVNKSIERIQEILDSGVRKLVVFAYHEEVIKRILDHFYKLYPAVVTGGSRKRQETIDRFVLTDCKLFIGQWKACGVGLNGLQNVCSKVLFVEVPLTPSEMNQASDRIHRIGQVNRRVDIEYCVQDGTVDLNACRLIEKKERIINKIINRRKEI